MPGLLSTVLTWLVQLHLRHPPPRNSDTGRAFISKGLTPRGYTNGGQTWVLELQVPRGEGAPRSFQTADRQPRIAMWGFGGKGPQLEPKRQGGTETRALGAAGEA